MPRKPLKPKLNIRQSPVAYDRVATGDGIRIEVDVIEVQYVARGYFKGKLVWEYGPDDNEPDLDSIFADVKAHLDAAPRGRKNCGR